MITAKLKCTNKVENQEGYVSLTFNANYRDDDGNLINQDWAYATPYAAYNTTVKAEVGALFEQGKSYLVTFEEE